MLIEVWSDIACPWCYIGKRRLESALAQFDHPAGVEVQWRSYQLDPSFPRGASEPEFAHLAAKFGGSLDRIRAMTDRVRAVAAGEGLAYDFENAVVVNTFDAHRVAHLGAAHGLGAQMHERLLRARLIEGEDLSDADVMARLAGEVGVPADEARAVLGSDEYAQDVRDDVAEGAAIGVTGVPFFVFDRAFAVSGAQPVETFLLALDKAAANA
jgi:predicted DsbA family dithiol-disulfide isomerase